MRTSNLRLRRTRPRGVTLTEVLVAIFIASLGLLALLALFPLGALSMAEAIRDDRASHLQDVADDLTVAAQQIDASAGQLRDIYAGWLQQQHVDVKQADVVVVILQSHDEQLSQIAQKVRERLPQLSDSDRQLAGRVLALLREGRAILRALERKLNWILKIQSAINPPPNPNEPPNDQQ